MPSKVKPVRKRLHGLPVWPMIILRSPKGWTGPKFVDGKPVEGTWRAHQVPVSDLEKPEHLKILEDWMKSYRARRVVRPARETYPRTRGTRTQGRAANGLESSREWRSAA